MSNQIPGVHSTSPSQPSLNLQPIDWVKLIPKQLSPELSLQDFEQSLNRFKSVYPVHSFSGIQAEGLQEGMSLSPEPGIPMSIMSRAVGAAAARILPSRD